MHGDATAAGAVLCCENRALPRSRAPCEPLLLNLNRFALPTSDQRPRSRPANPDPLECALSAPRPKGYGLQVHGAVAAVHAGSIARHLRVRGAGGHLRSASSISSSDQQQQQRHTTRQRLTVLLHNWVRGKGVSHAQPAGGLGGQPRRRVARHRLLQPLLRPRVPLLPQLLGDCARAGEGRGGPACAAAPRGGRLGGARQARACGCSEQRAPPRPAGLAWRLRPHQHAVLVNHVAELAAAGCSGRQAASVTAAGGGGSGGGNQRCRGGAGWQRAQGAAQGASERRQHVG